MKRGLLILFMCAFMSVPASADLTVNVPGTSTTYFAGQTTTVPYVGPLSYFNVDRADALTLPAYADTTGLGSTISITASGLWDHTPVLAAGSGPDGKPSFFPTDADYDDLGISLMQGAPVNMLLGVFLTDAAPVVASLPVALTWGDDMTSPLLQQTFAIGAALDDILVPTGATRLFFGLNNGWEWTNNTGSVDVTIVPVPGAVLLGMLGLSVVGAKLRKYA